MFTALT